MPYKIRHYKHKGTGYSNERVNTVTTYPTKAVAAAYAKKLNKMNKGINARVVKA